MTYFKAKMHQIRFRLVLRPRPRWGAYSAPQSTRPPAGFGGPLRGKGRGWAGEEEGKGEGKGREGEVEGREREGPKITVEPGPLRALLRHWLLYYYYYDDDYDNFRFSLTGLFVRRLLQISPGPPLFFKRRTFGDWRCDLYTPDVLPRWSNQQRQSTDTDAESMVQTLTH